MKLFEAFEALDALNEETFAVSDDGVEKLDTFMQDNEDSDDIVDVIDPEAETEEDIQDSYVGKVILDCAVCHSKIYKDKTDVTIEEEQQLANVGEDCPYCYTSDGFKVIGEVAPFADKDEETDDVKEEEEEVVEESLTEAVNGIEHWKPKVISALDTYVVTIGMPDSNNPKKIWHSDKHAIVLKYSEKSDVFYLSKVNPNWVMNSSRAKFKTYEDAEKFGKSAVDPVEIYNISKSRYDDTLVEIPTEYEDAPGVPIFVSTEFLKKVAPRWYDKLMQENRNTVTKSKDEPVEKGHAKTEPLTESTVTMDRPLSSLSGTLSNVMTAHQDELAAISSKHDALAFLNYIEPEVKNKGYLATVKEKVAKLPDFKVLTFLYNIILKGDGMGKLESLIESHRGDRHRVTAELFDILSENGFDTDAEDVEDYVFAARDLVFEEVLADPSKSLREIVEQWFEDTKVNYPEDLESLTRFEEGLFGIKTKKEKEKEAKAKAEKERQKQRDKELKDQEERARQQSVADSWARNDKAKRDAEKEYNRNRSTTQGSRVSNTSKAGVHYSGGDYYSEDLKESFKIVDRKTGFTIDNGFTTEKDALNEIEDKYQSEIGRYRVVKEELDESKSINENINNLSLDTDDTHMEMTSDESGKVTITTEPIETAETSDEVIVPVSDETKTEIENNNVETEEDVDFEEFDETSFDELGESYLKESFDNVVAFRTNDVTMSGNDLIVEGLIKFDSGNVKKTSFTFTAKDFLKEGLYRFVGKNNQLVESNSFELVGKIKDTKFICESLTEVK